jgi:hypothetical protein
LVSVAAPQLAPSCAQVEGVHPVLPSPKLAKPSPPPASESGAEESLPPELLLVASAEASFENDEGPLPWPPPQPGTTAA